MVPEGITLEDPRPTAAGAPYTFFMPHPDELAALKPRDGIQAIFHQPGCTGKFDTERMWVLIERIENGSVIGTLDNEPAGLDKIRLGDPVRIPLTHAISTAFHKDNPRPIVPVPRDYWDRCFVDKCVLNGRSRVDYLYREEPYPLREGEKYPDSGWRIRGTQEAIDDDEKRGESPSYIALGKVLNSDDRWRHLIDREIGVAFQWDEIRQGYIQLD